MSELVACCLFPNMNFFIFPLSLAPDDLSNSFDDEMMQRMMGFASFDSTKVRTFLNFRKINFVSIKLQRCL